MTERQFHELMNAIYDLAVKVDNHHPELAWKMPQLIVRAALDATNGTLAAAWVERWKMGDEPLEDVPPDVEPEYVEHLNRIKG